MKRSAILKTLPLICAASLFAGGCAVYPDAPVATMGEEVDVGGEPPAPVVEQIYPAPAVGYIWIGGIWLWQGHWVWERGHWERPPYPDAIWIPHRYVVHNGRYFFVRGGWR